MTAGEILFFKDDQAVGRVDFCEPQLNLLAHAQLIELQTGSRCGGHGVCGGDRIRMENVRPGDVSELTEKEKLHLSPEEIAQGYRLACQCYPNASSLRLSVRLEY